MLFFFSVGAIPLIRINIKQSAEGTYDRLVKTSNVTVRMGENEPIRGYLPKGK